jgi:hypothetical protein
MNPREHLRKSFSNIFLLALGVRLLYLAAFMAAHPAHWRGPDFGWWEIGNIAVNVFQGRGFSSPFFRGNVPTAWLCPLVPYLWAAVMRLMGGANGRTEQVLVLLQSVPSALSVAFYWLIARYLTRRIPGVPPDVETVAALVLCFWPESLLRLTYLYYFVWQELGVVVLVYLGLRWCDRPTLWSGSALGAIGGLTALVNINPIPIFLVALGTPFLERRSLDTRLLRAMILSILTATLIVAPWIVRDALMFGRLYPVRSNTAFELFQGNNPKGCIREQADSAHPMSNPKEMALYQSLGESEYVRRSGERAWDYICHHPGRTALRVGERFYVAWCTDLFNDWPWNPSDRWWPRGEYNKWLLLATISSALISLGVVIFALVSGRLRGLPHAALFISVFIFLPLPHYFTQIDNEYTQTLRSWLALLAIVALCRRAPGLCNSLAKR